MLGNLGPHQEESPGNGGEKELLQVNCSRMQTKSRETGRKDRKKSENHPPVPQPRVANGEFLVESVLVAGSGDKLGGKAGRAV